MSWLLGVLGVGGASWYFRDWLAQQYEIAKVVYKTAQHLQKNDVTATSAVYNEKSMCVMYAGNSEKHSLRLPFRYDRMGVMSMFQAELHTDIGILDITQEAGLPYLCTPQELGGFKIVITNHASGKFQAYTEAPMYATELDWQE